MKVKKNKAMPLKNFFCILLFGGALQLIEAVAFGDITVQQNLGAGATSWPGTPLISTTSTPDSTVGESFSGTTTTSLGQTFTLAAGNNYTLPTVYLNAGGGTGTSSSATITVNLYDLGAITAPNPNPYSTNNNLLGGGSGVAITYTTQTTGLLKLEFTGTLQVTLGAGHMYAFEIAPGAISMPVAQPIGTAAGSMAAAHAISPWPSTAL